MRKEMTLVVGEKNPKNVTSKCLNAFKAKKKKAT
jgi:hypothetical protein